MIDIRHQSKGFIYTHLLIKSSTQLQLSVLLAQFTEENKPQITKSNSKNSVILPKSHNLKVKELHLAPNPL